MLLQRRLPLLLRNLAKGQQASCRLQELRLQTHQTSQNGENMGRTGL